MPIYRMSSTCTICCNNKTTVISSLCNNVKCMGNICSNCVSEIIKIKKNDNEKTICMYECPFCKTVNDNILPPTSATMVTLYRDYKDEDGFLYMSYCGENTFGAY